MHAPKILTMLARFDNHTPQFKGVSGASSTFGGIGNAF
ncbi:hypothetical protein HHE014_16590 [Helicobacter heilmannii]|nr:hypothetical protein HHE014_16590 [Helicobacter heilmannii]